MFVSSRNTAAASLEGRRFASGPARRQLQIHAAKRRDPCANRAREIPGRGLAPDGVAQDEPRLLFHGPPVVRRAHA